MSVIITMDATASVMRMTDEVSFALLVFSSSRCTSSHRARASHALAIALKAALLVSMLRHRTFDHHTVRDATFK